MQPKDAAEVASTGEGLALNPYDYPVMILAEVDVPLGVAVHGEEQRQALDELATQLDHKIHAVPDTLCDLLVLSIGPVLSGVQKRIFHEVLVVPLQIVVLQPHRLDQDVPRQGQILRLLDDGVDVAPLANDPAGLLAEARHPRVLQDVIVHAQTPQLAKPLQQRVLAVLPRLGGRRAIRAGPSPGAFLPPLFCRAARFILILGTEDAVVQRRPWRCTPVTPPRSSRGRLPRAWRATPGTAPSPCCWTDGRPGSR
eukprot:scaffold2117_cov241-Pinguiococcus_pyrenoidosus.AAC.2